MKKSVVKMVCLVLTVMLAVVSMSACGSPAQTKADNTTAAAVTTAGAEPTQAVAKPVKFTIAVCQPAPEKDFKDLYLPAQEFMKNNPNVTIEFQGMQLDEYQKKMDMEAQSNSLPDLFWRTSADAAPYIKMGAVADLTDDLKADPEFSGYFNPGALDNFTTDGKIYAIPEKTDIMGFFYNKALFTKYNVKIPETWDELLNAVKVFNQNGIIPIAQGTKDTWAVWGYYLLFNRYGWDDFQPKWLAKQVKMGGSDMQKAFGRLQELAKAGAFPKNLTTIDYSQMEQLFLGGKAAMYQTGSWQLNDLEKSDIAKDLDFNWGPSLPDGIADQKLALKETTSGLWISAKTKQNADVFKALWAYLKFHASPEGTKIVVEQANYIPATKYTGDGATLGPVFKLALAKLGDEYKARTEFPILVSSTLNQPLWDAESGVMNGIMTPEQACKILDDWNDAR